MKSPESIDALIRTRWAFVVGLATGGALVHAIGLVMSLSFGAGILTMGLIAEVTGSRRGR